MPTVPVPRRSFRSANTLEVHVFSDASITAFAAVIHARQPASSQTSAQQRKSEADLARQTHTFPTVYRLRFTLALSWPPRIRTARSSNSYAFTARLGGAHNKTLPEARS